MVDGCGDGDGDLELACELKECRYEDCASNSGRDNVDNGGRR